MANTFYEKFGNKKLLEDNEKRTKAAMKKMTGSVSEAEAKMMAKEYVPTGGMNPMSNKELEYLKSLMIKAD
tara:strand:+ start:279 stop:491 length:213 start_codon:yes stop_codon:yes gene_type:complete